MSLLILSSGTNLSAQNSEILIKKWQLLDDHESQLTEAEFPASVQSSLVKMHHDLNRFSNSYEAQLSQFENKTWYFETTFVLSKELFESREIWLEIEELDANAELFLNSESIGIHQTPFIPFKRNLKYDKLVVGKNVIRIKCRSWLNLGKTLLDEQGFGFPADNDQTANKISPFIRKPAYQFGWDFAPKHLTTGIHSVPKIIFVEKARIESCQIKMTSLNAVKSQLVAELKMSQDGDYKIEIENITENEIAGEGQFNGNNGTTNFEVLLPKMWWPKGMGAANLYSFNIKVSQNGQLIDSRKVTTGLRDTELIQEADVFGNSFYFKVNGYPAYARGLNYVPMDVDLSQVNRLDYEAFFDKINETGINMLRVWGGGTYERETFYNYCDKSGIMVWQDFMFANTTYPDLESFYQSVELEANYQTKRLSHHPCIVHWNGNNEIDVAWKNWGWQSTYKMSGKAKKKMMASYEKIFKEILPVAVKTNSSSSYTHSSPLSNWGPNGDLKSGSLHYWGVWHGKEDIKAYKDNVGRFVSEYGFQSYPSDNILKLYDPSFKGDYSSLKGRQKSYIGDAEIDKQMMAYFGKVKPGNKAYVSQLLQALAMEKAILAHRMKKPECAGTLMWQSNDCWPGASWSAMDFHHNEKAVYRTLEALMNPIQIIEEVHPDFLVLFAVNDSIANATAKLEVTFYDFEGNKIVGIKETANLNKATANVLASIPLEGVLKDKTPQEVYAVARLSNSAGIINERIIVLDDPKNLKLQDPEGKLEYFKEKGKNMVRSKTFVYAPQFLLEQKVNDQYGNRVFGIRGSHMLPGKAYVIDEGCSLKYYLPE